MQCHKEGLPDICLAVPILSSGGMKFQQPLHPVSHSSKKNVQLDASTMLLPPPFPSLLFLSIYLLRIFETMETEFYSSSHLFNLVLWTKQDLKLVY